MHYAEIEQLLESGAHFGHLTRRWNPKMQQFIFMERNGIHIIDLRKTQVLIDIARDAAYDLAAQGKIILFVGTKTQAKAAMATQSARCNMHHVSERWLGGMLTNFSTIRKSIKRLATIDKMEVDGTFEKITKKERLLLNREKDRLRKVFGGIEEMSRLPGALFVVDIKKEHIAVNEAKILGIPVIAIVDTNCDPELVDFPIPANDDSIKTVELVSKILADAILDGTEISRMRMAELGSDDDRLSKESDAAGLEDPSKVTRRMRERRTRRDERPRQSGRPSSSQQNSDEHDSKSANNDE